ncbi:MAG: AMP-binding protein [Campylobacterota bacterium]|nr:AMP-binding protein [Campylobacterota bacterium]
MNRQNIDFEKFKNNIFYKDGKNEKTWEEAFIVVKLLTEYFNHNQFKEGDVVAINTNKDFHTYCAILACYIYGITFSPIRFQEINKSISIDKEININCFLSSSKSNFKKSTYIFDLLNEKKTNKLYKLEENQNSIAYILHSSGSTGKPKIIPISYKNLHSYINSVKEITTFDLGMTFAQTVELTFDLSIHDMFLCFHHGGSLVPLSTSIAKFAPRFINSLQVNNLMMVPSFLSAMEAVDITLDSVKNVFFCGEALSRKIAKQSLSLFPKASIFNFYGPTEATVAVSYFKLDINSIGDESIVPIGSSFSSTVFKLSDEGELLIGGEQVFNGYLGNIEKNPFTIINDCKYYKSGDICSFEEDNYKFKSRIDYQVKFRGYRIELEGVEALLNNKFKASFAAIGNNEISSNNYANIVIFYDNKNLIIEEIKNFLPKHLNGAVLKYIENIPRNTSGKIDRHYLKKVIS